MIDTRVDAAQMPKRRLSLRRRRPRDPVYDMPESRDELSLFPPDYSLQPPTVTVVIPALNEARNLPYVFAKLPDGLHEVIIVDGNSVDDTVATARRLRPDVRVVTQNRSGKGNALACGFAAATGDIVVMVDADGSADPAEIPRRTHYSDLCYGYNAFWRRHVPLFGLDAETDIPVGGGARLWGDGFEVETLINIRIAQAELIVAEIASYEHSRIHGVSNLNAASDGWRVLRTILAERYYYRRRTAARKRKSRGLLRHQRTTASESANHAQ